MTMQQIWIISKKIEKYMSFTYIEKNQIKIQELKHIIK